MHVCDEPFGFFRAGEFLAAGNLIGRSARSTGLSLGKPCAARGASCNRGDLRRIFSEFSFVVAPWRV